jgi:hypothetical protein
MLRHRRLHAMVQLIPHATTSAPQLPGRTVVPE